MAPKENEGIHLSGHFLFATNLVAAGQQRIAGSSDLEFLINGRALDEPPPILHG